MKPGESIGAVKLGMTKAELVGAIGAPESSSAHDATHEYVHYAGGGLQVSIEAGKVKGIFAFSGIAGGYEKATKRFDARAPKGVTLDATYDQVVASLGKPDKEGELTHAPIPSKWIAYAGMSFEFVKASGKMISISVQSAPLPPKTK